MRPAKCDLLVFGTGSLSRSVCYSIASVTGPRIAVHVAGRRASDVDEVVAVSEVRAAVLNSGASFVGSVLNWNDEEALFRVLTDVAPKIVLHVSSLQSPWDLHRPGCRWSNIIRQGGFGVTMPLQVHLALQVARTLKKINSTSLLINGCYPDAVNPLLKALGLDIFCGIGNIAILTAALESIEAASRSFRMLAHHIHVGMLAGSSSTASATSFPRVWRDNEELDFGFLGNISVLRNVRGAELNQITGCTGACLIRNVLSEKRFSVHVPGPLGLPGGYPVLIERGTIQLDLPGSITIDQAVAYNQDCGRQDGVVIEDGSVCFSERATQAMRTVWPGVPTRFPAHEIDSVCRELLEIRSRLGSS